MRTVLLLIVFLSGCAPPSGQPSAVPGLALAGPVCPVITTPPDPSCADRPVAGATIAARREGREVARAVTAEDGTFMLELPPGTYLVEGLPVEGLMGVPAPVRLEVRSGATPERIVLVYDTGIR